jgi:hypothetical protein
MVYGEWNTEERKKSKTTKTYKQIFFLRPRLENTLCSLSSKTLRSKHAFLAATVESILNFDC